MHLKQTMVMTLFELSEVHKQKIKVLMFECRCSQPPLVESSVQLLGKKICASASLIPESNHANFCKSEVGDEVTWEMLCVQSS